MQAQIFKAMLFCTASVGFGRRVQVFTRPCSEDSVFCTCTTDPTQELTLLSGKRLEFGIAMVATFHVSGPGWTAVQEKNEGLAMDCNEEKADEKSVCSCSGPPDIEVRLTTSQCLFNTEPRMCLSKELDDLQYLRCYTASGDKHSYHNGPADVPDTLKYAVKDVKYCEPWKMHKGSRRTQCFWKPLKTIEDKTPTSTQLSEACEAALGTVGEVNDRTYWQIGTFEVVNSINSTASGLANRLSKVLSDKADFRVMPSQKWGTKVDGVTTGDGWLKVVSFPVGRRYLPMFIGGSAVIKPKAGGTSIGCAMNMKLEKCLGRLSEEEVEGKPFGKILD